MKKVILLVSALMILISLNAKSVFSLYGMPETFSGADAVGLGMGETGIGNVFRQNLSLNNPSLLTNNLYTVFATAYSFGNSTSKGDLGSYDGDQGYFPYFSFILPYKQHRFGINYSSISNGLFSTEFSSTGSDGSTSKEVHRIDQSIYRTDIVYANKNQIADFGVGFCYYFGHDTNFSSFSFNTDSLVTTKTETENNYKAPGFLIGVSKTFDDKYSLGLSFVLPTTLKGDRTFKNVVISETDGDSKFELPAKISVGAGYKIGKFSDLAFDFDYEDWTSVNSLKNPVKSWRTGLGIEYAGNPESNSFFKKMGYRTGFSYQVLPFSLNNNNINEISGTIGLSLPIKLRDSKLDLALKLFKRGNKSDNGYEDSGFLITFGTLGFDIFTKPVNRKGHRDIPVPDNSGM